MRLVAYTLLGFFLTGLSTKPLDAQVSLDQVVIGANGGKASNGGLVLEYTLGESVIGQSSSVGLHVDYGFWWMTSHGTVAVVDPPPTQFVLGRSSPTPFSTTTTMTFAIPAGPSVPVLLGIYDVHGSLVTTLIRGQRAGGVYSATWDGRRDDGGYVSAGVYFAKLNAASFSATSKVVLLK